MTEEPIRIDRHELFDPAIDNALARDRAGRERIVADAPVSPFRRLLLNSLFHLPLASVLGAFLAWALLDANIHDNPVVAGQIILINADPFDANRGTIALTIGKYEVMVDTNRVKLERGSDGAPAFANARQLKIGDRVEAAGIADSGRLFANAIRPTTKTGPPGELEDALWAVVLLFPLTAAFVAFALLFVEGLTTRNWTRMIERSVLGSLLATVFAVLAFVPAGLFLMICKRLIEAELAQSGSLVLTIDDFSGLCFLVCTACRGAAWASMGAAIGVGMNLVRSTRAQLRNSAIGGSLGGAFGGLFFDPIDRFFGSRFDGGSASRLVGLIAVGLSIGLFVALVERLGRDAWLRVKTGPLAGKSFILYKTPTSIGNSPQSDIYLYKDAEIDPSHASIHRIGTTYEIEDMGTRMGISVDGNRVRRVRLVSGNQIVIGSTILDFGERQKRTPLV